MMVKGALLLATPQKVAILTKQPNMGNNTEYFQRKAYEAKYVIGQRVSGKWNKIPFVGSVGNDRLVSEEIGPEITIHLDLPILLDNKIHSIIVVKHKDIKLLKEL